jgi:uncharacterized membrane protein YhaH (DUF805 family)
MGPQLALAFARFTSDVLIFFFPVLVLHTMTYHDTLRPSCCSLLDLVPALHWRNNMFDTPAEFS